MPLSAIIFDFDGVIANSEPLHYRAFRDELVDRGIALSERDYYKTYLGFDDAGAFRAIAAHAGVRWSERDIAAMVASKALRMEALEHDLSVLFPGAAEAIRRAAAEVPIAIASGALSAEIRRTLDREGLTRHFVAIVGADQTAASKPAPDPYLHAVAAIEASLHTTLQARDCVAIEDSLWGLESARTAGLRTVAIAQTYAADALAGAADLVIGTIGALDCQPLRSLCSD